MKRIASPQNPLIKRALALHRPGGPAEADEILIEGEKLLREALRSGVELRHLFVQEGSEERWRDQADRMVLVPPALLRRLSRLDTPPTAVGLAVPPAAPPLEALLSKARTLVVLDRVQDPGNLGTILRSLEALGGDGLLLLTGCASPANPKVIRAAMGSSFRVPLLTGLEGQTLLARLRAAGFACLATGPAGDDLRHAPLPARIAFFLGSEGTGLAPALRTACDRCLTIPMPGPAESLNVAIATAICLYERLRRQSPASVIPPLRGTPS